jgi:hypothetical protein
VAQNAADVPVGRLQRVERIGHQQGIGPWRMPYLIPAIHRACAHERGQEVSGGAHRGQQLAELAHVAGALEVAHRGPIVSLVERHHAHERDGARVVGALTQRCARQLRRFLHAQVGDGPLAGLDR